MLEAIGYMAIGTFFALLLPISKAWAETKKEWVNLTDEEVADLVEYEDWYNYPADFAKTIEAKLRNKNGG